MYQRQYIAPVSICILEVVSRLTNHMALLQVGSGANPCSFVPMHYFSTVNAQKSNFDTM
jgi:hypothetical protein